MNIVVKLFAGLRDKVGAGVIQLEMPARTNATGILIEVVKRYPSTETLVASAAIAVNQEYASRETPLQDGDEVALIPPVSGG